MAKIVINEISQNYTFSTGTSSYATVALPITSCWGPGYFDPDTYYGDSLGPCEDNHEYMLEHTVWQRFPATQAGLESFVSTYRGPSSVYRRAKDYSYQMAMTLLTSGYDILVCRLCPGTQAQGQFKQLERKADPSDPSVIRDAIITFRAKYPGTFGNNLQISIRKNMYFDQDSRERRIYWSVITHVIDASGVKTSVENISLVFNLENSTDTVPYYKDAESKYWDVSLEGEIDEAMEDAPDDATKIQNLSQVQIPYPVMYDADGNEVPPDEDPPHYSIPVKDMNYIRLVGGDDIQNHPEDYTAEEFEQVVEPRYLWAQGYNTSNVDSGYNSYERYIEMFGQMIDQQQTISFLSQYDKEVQDVMYYREWIYTRTVGVKRNHSANEVVIDDMSLYDGVLDLLKDKLAYSPNRIISPGWDDQDYSFYIDDMDVISHYILKGDFYTDPTEDDCPGTCAIPVSPLHLKIMDVAYYSRCATGYLDIPRVVGRKYVHIEDEMNLNREGYVQKLARVVPYNAALDVNGSLYHTHCGLFAPWGQFRYSGTGKMNTASPSFLALMIQRAQILNQPDQYEWELPINRKHNLRIGKLDYTVPKKLLDKWQKLDGASVNVITTIPDLGTNIWGNSTLYEVPPVTYQALANLSTRFLVNAVEDVAYRCGISITFSYNNNQAYNKFYAGVTPILDTMKNVGAIEDYYVRMQADINGLDYVNANTVVGKIYLVINGVINDIIVDLVALPPGTDLNQYKQ